MKRNGQFQYSKLTKILKDQIFSGQIKPGEFLLSENELCKHYGLSRTSVRRSLEDLVHAGIIVKQPGKGSMVDPHLVVEEDHRKTLRIVTPPSHFVDYGLDIMIDRFQAEFPDVKVQVLRLPNEKFWESIRTGSQMGLNPDLVLITEFLFNEMEHRDDYSDLDGIAGLDMAGIYPKLSRIFDFQGNQKAVPVTFSPVFMAYNESLFEQYGVDKPSPHWEYADFLRASQALNKDVNKDGIQDLYGLSFSTHYTRWPVFALQNGFDFSQNPVDEAAIRPVFDMLHDMLFRQKIAMLNQKISSTLGVDIPPFVYGKSAMTLATTFDLASWGEHEMDFQPQLSKLPFGPVPSTILTVNGFMVPEDSENHDLAGRFIALALQPEIQTQFCEQTPFLSVHADVNKQMLSTEELDSLYISDVQMEKNYFLHELFARVELMQDINAAMGLFWTGLESAQEMASNYCQIVNRNES